MTDRDLVHLKDLAKLEKLSILGPKVTDDGMIHVKDIPELRILTLQCPQITGDEIPYRLTPFWLQLQRYPLGTSCEQGSSVSPNRRHKDNR
jgi:hypothetical protein